MLTTADTNLKMGTAYFADLVKQFGGAHFALASYNAGEGRVVAVLAARRGERKVRAPQGRVVGNADQG